MIATVAGWLCLIPVLAISAVFAVEMAMGLLPARRIFARSGAPDIAVIMPAHDEASGISAALMALRPALPTDARLLVVADNCSDMTASLARTAGAEVIERVDPDRRGKGHALAFARDHLAGSPPEVAIVIDADCQIAPAGIARLAAAAAETGRPIQASYRLRPRISAGPMVELSGFAFLVKNVIRQRGLARIGAPAILTGSGMAFPWPIFAAAPLATGDSVEDLLLGIALAERGQAPLFLPDVAVWSDPSSAGGTLEQRRRWEQGFLATACGAAGRLIGSGRGALIWLGAHLLVPPLALLMIAHLLLLLGLAGLRLAGGAILPLAIEALTVATLTVLVGIAWFRHGREQMRPVTWLHIPAYMLWKIPLYLAAFARRERRWTRTDRDPVGKP